jgi:hypothetical protein
MIKNFNSRIAVLILVALVLTSIMSISARATHHNVNQANLPNQSIDAAGEAPEALLPPRNVFQPPRFQASYAVPNFGMTIRKAPIRRKGRIQH